ncbi:MAG TPA: NADH-quinone oxidoreductase subunit C [Chloroflexota bacterium]|nr:NADH-quinone oxidoreductase subunit C [Chloroflexota bacterium]
MDVEMIRAQLGTAQPWEKRPDGYWLEDPLLKVRDMARCMVRNGARLMTVTATPVAGGEQRLAYHWDLEGQVTTLIAGTHQNTIDTIVDICPAADWIEREIHDYFAVSFAGRQSTPPLTLRPNDPPGFFFWKGQDGEQS